MIGYRFALLVSRPDLGPIFFLTWISPWARGHGCTDKGKPALSRRAGACSSRHERERLGVGEPVSFLAGELDVSEKIRTVLTST